MAKQHYRVIGFLEGSSGLAVAAKNTLHALRASGREVEEIHIDPTRRDSQPTAPRTSTPASTVNLFHMNPMEIGAYASQWGNLVDLADQNVCVPFWELPLVPRNWEPMLRAMDLLLAPTPFVAEACARVIDERRIVPFSQAVFPPQGIVGDRARWGIAENAMACVVSFDVDSGVERKNPWAAIDAFQRAFPADPSVQLVLKTKPRSGADRSSANKHLLVHAGHDDRIVLVDESLSYTDVLQLYASCDVMISLHRSEGLGLHLMEAMSCGTVVVATGWSGNLDFMTEENSVLIPYALVPVQTQHPAYRSEAKRKGQVWAEPNAGVAERRLRELRENPEARLALGARAAADMKRRRDAHLMGQAFDELELRLEKLESNAGAFSSALASTMAALRRQRLIEKWRAVQGTFRIGSNQSRPARD